jgi:hypothetical protein
MIEPEDQLCSADHSLKNAGVVHPAVYTNIGNTIISHTQLSFYFNIQIKI